MERIKKTPYCANFSILVGATKLMKTANLNTQESAINSINLDPKRKITKDVRANVDFSTQTLVKTQSETELAHIWNVVSII